MKKVLHILLFSCLLSSCDNGDIVVTSFDLQESNLSMCGNDSRVLYAVNNADVFESMSIEITHSDLEDSLANVLTTNTEENIEIDLSNNNRLVYRIYDGEVPSNYFCSQVPPKDPQVIQEYLSTSGGSITIATNFNDIAPTDDADADGVNNEDEGMDVSGNNHQDTNNDGIPDYLDIDDDGDNVPTRTEINLGSSDPTEEGYPDTDEDGTPNYLDNDDDDDGILTIYEVNEEFITSPQSVISTDVADYLNPQVETFLEHEERIDLDITRNYRSTIIITDFKLVNQDGSGEEIRFEEYNLGFFGANAVPFPQNPDTDTDDEDEDEENTEEEPVEEETGD